MMNVNSSLRPAASKKSSPADFDFLVGSWQIHNKKLKTRLNDCQEWTEFEAFGKCCKILNRMGNIDSFVTDLDGKPFEGMALRLFNPSTRLWSIYWADSEAVTLDVPQIGSFENRVGEFYARDVWEGKNIIVLFRWDATDPNEPKWSQAFSSDEKTWEWNWHMNFRRQS